MLQQRDKMVMLPRNVLLELGRMIAPRKTATYKEILNHFIVRGYGPNKVNKWVNYYVDADAMKENDDGTFTCVWW